ncbi:metallophosphoesterase [Prosthecobacter sp.]|uniref:metallophosphoesterase family protein n=1 Tax=Prosthecobacter sp. TaxID=1965333 RepID=UPI002AB95C68|nr:metallophosphoesterase [Prosthecobacter sp.]MDZ4404758.1 metallophosphoesterase [Prosthecobacter sp.]
MNSPATFSRRHFLTSAASLTGAAGLLNDVQAATAESKPFSFVFFTDPHVQPEKGAVDGVKMALAKVNALEQKPDFVITGGDLIMDALEVGIDRVETQWKLWDECLKTLEAPSYHTVGNHDVAGWSPKAMIKPGESAYGKALFADRYGQGRTYRSFDHGGWHFIILDSIGLDKATNDYMGWIDDDQLAWLQADLEKTGKQTPIILVTHIPFYSVWHQVILGPKINIGGKALVGNVHDFRKMLGQYNLKLVLSGHGHISERIQFDKVVYLQGGAVCGMWWKGPVHGNPEGFLQVECHPDGTFTDRYHGYGWKAQA